MRPLRALFAVAVLAAGHALPAAAETAIFAGGCFWCVEADLDKVDGVTATVSGYTGGTTEGPTYKTYEAGGHREAVRIEFDPARVGYRDLVAIFLRTVDVTDAGGQFCDRGHGYTTAIYVLDEAQRRAAEAERAAAEQALGRPVVTPVEDAAPFWPAEDYHQDYYRSQERTLTRFGYVTRASAYKGYRDACGRDRRVKEVWGDDAYKGLPKAGS
ncbi:peptide-methionine (S)-S-oxide reductase MsrA [Polymorphum gilvum]|uniref:Peptide methionine sulfoxide reductase MsrA n=1 Tax=Polymorphum gilvum (strain LMG 25793 / CGMCC 1.9160 / SL003B-26A1) TaxID=991905 RepID=F2IVE5_POLGS|nr:peptide-methionine (S)-S-oxide reductase MsrA [Polymorphum gilvum]ADZ72663.1 Peptide methionine sulfoxide reductase superfamily [Polymorphum gilvum SL003B-26A1]